ncbi:MAG TPA: ABC transporter substrate-binding protein [Steroidobacteraceae bacterium]|nr:ABC transporter substrate-binding protein [Steroidobacteraceae bacterium]
MRSNPLRIAAAALMLAGWLIQGVTTTAAAQGASQQQPSQVIEDAANGLLKALNADREEYRKHPAKVQALVDQYILPHVDTQFAAQLVLGKYWRKATPQQRERFVNAFYHSMLNNYGAAIVEFTSNTLKVFPSRVSPGSQNATVRTEMVRTSGPPVNVNYYMHMTPQGWKAWDVVIDGVSYVMSYRQDFGSQIDQQGIDSVINRLEQGEKPPQIGKTTGAKP